MNEQLFNPDGWLNLGVAGAALFLILIFILLMFKQQGKSIDKLCDKLDKVTDAFTESNLTLREVIICNDKDQKELLRIIGDLSNTVQDMHIRVVRLDTRLFELYQTSDEPISIK